MILLLLIGAYLFDYLHGPVADHALTAVWPAVIAAGAALAGGYMASRSQSSANQANVEAQKLANKANVRMNREAILSNVHAAKKQMDFQERMSNTAYQRSMQDLKKAGLNPMLAYSQGGASAPQGAMSTATPGHVEATKQQVEDGLSKGVSSAADAIRLHKEIKAVESQAQLNDALKDTQKTQQALNNSSAASADAAAKVAQATEERIKSEMPAVKAQARYQAAKADIDTKMVKPDAITNRLNQYLGTANSALDLIKPKWPKLERKVPYYEQQYQTPKVPTGRWPRIP